MKTFYRLTVEQLEERTLLAAAQGVDVSSFQGGIDWTTVHNVAGIDFAYARVSDGTSPDSFFDLNYSRAKSAGLIRGASQYFEPGEPVSAQAALLIQKIGTLAQGDLPPALDLETTGGRSPADLLAEINTWTAIVADAIGRMPVIFTGASFWNSAVGSSSFGSDPLWVASLSASNPTLPQGWTTYEIVHYANFGQVSGIPALTGLDQFNGTSVDLANFAVNPTITLSPSTLPAASVALPYNQSITASGGTAPYTYAVTGGALPPGLSLNTGTGQISGTPTAGGAYTFTVQATDANTTAGPFHASQNCSLTVNLPGATYDPASKTLTIAAANFTSAQKTTEHVVTTHTTYTFTADGTSESLPDMAVSSVIVNGVGTSAKAILVTNDTYVDTSGTPQETRESIALGSRADAGAGTLQKFDSGGNPHTFLTLNHFPISYAYVGRRDGAVSLYGTAGVAYNGFVSAGNYSYIGGPGLFHLAQGAADVYGYSAGQATDFAYHYAANAGSSYVVSGIAFSYMSCTDTVAGVTQPYFNVAVGFTVNTGVAKNPGQDFAYIIDSPQNDTFVGLPTYSYMYVPGFSGGFAELDAAFGFSLVYGESFVGGVDTATNSDPSHIILVGFHL